MAAYLFSFVVPYLVAAIGVLFLLRLLGVEVSKGPGRFFALAVPLTVVCLPLGDYPLARVVIGLNANFSITLAAVLLSAFLSRLQGAHLLDRRALRTIRYSGLLVGLLLYPSAEGMGPFDFYQLGWGSVWLLCPLFFLTIFLIFRDNGFGLVLAACVAAYLLRLLESDNLWDYLSDPFLTIWCVVMTAMECLSGIRSLFSTIFSQRGAGFADTSGTGR